MEFWRSPMNFYNSRRPRQTMNNQTPMAVWRAGMDSPLPVSVFGDLLDSEQGRNPEAGQGHMINGDFKTVGPRQVDAGEGRTDVSPADFTEPMGLQCLLLLDLRISGVPDDPVATCVGIDWRIFGRHEAIRSCGEVNDLIVWFLGEGLPSVDLAHGDLS